MKRTSEKGNGYTELDDNLDGPGFPAAYSEQRAIAELEHFLENSGESR